MESTIVDWGQLLLRLGVGLMLLFIHGRHKLEGAADTLWHGTPWSLVEEIAQMHVPAPLAAAIAATVVQCLCSLLLIVGLYTRISAALLVIVLCVATLQNLVTHRDPQLALLYTLIVLSLVFLGGGRFSLDARWLE